MNVDFLSPNLEFYMTTKKLTTRIGVIISIVLCLLLISSGIYFIKKFLSIDKPYIISSSLQQSEIAFSNFDRIPLGVRLTDEFGNSIAREGVFNLKNTYITSKKSDSFVQKYFETDVVTCRLGKHIPQEYEELIKDVKLDNFYCAEWDPQFEYNLLNLYGGAIDFSFDGFSFNQCKPSVQSNNCKPQVEIDQLLANPFVEILYIDYDIVNSEIVPITPKLNVYRTPTSSLSFLRIWMAVAQGEYTTDTGIIFEDKSTLSYYSLQVLKEQYKGLSKADVEEGIADFLIISFQNYDKKSFYLRSYLKAQEAFANFGGIVKGLFIIAQIFYFCLSRKEYWVQLANMLPERAINDHKEIKSLKINALIKPPMKNEFKRQIDFYEELTFRERVLPDCLLNSSKLKLFQTKINILKGIFSAQSLIKTTIDVESLKLNPLHNAAESQHMSYLSKHQTEFGNISKKFALTSTQTPII